MRCCRPNVRVPDNQRTLGLDEKHAQRVIEDACIESKGVKKGDKRTPCRSEYLQSSAVIGDIYHVNVNDGIRAKV